MLFGSNKSYDLTGWTFEQLNPYSSLYKKDGYILNVKLIDSPDVGICNVVDIYKDDQFLTSKNNLEEALIAIGENPL